MKRSLVFALGAILLACAVCTPTATAATEAEKLAAIQAGLAHLAATQCTTVSGCTAYGYYSYPFGSWNYAEDYEQAATGAAAMAFMSAKAKWGANASQYQTVVNNAMAFLLATATKVTVSTRNDGVNICPGGSGSCPGVYWYGDEETTYTTGLVAPAIATYGASLGANVVATTTGPLAGMTWLQIAQGITNVFAAGQSTSLNGNKDGGWRYYPGDGDADSSTTQWAVIALVYDETLGATTPAAVKTDLRKWLTGNANLFSSGGVAYQPIPDCCGIGVTTSDTGGWLLAMKYAGYDLTNSRVQQALGFLNTNWTTTAYNDWYGNFGHPYAMFATYKGLETNIGLTDTTHITSLRTGCGASRSKLPGNPPGSVACNWFEDYNEWLVTNQSATDGSWAGYSEWTDPLSTAFDVSILDATYIPVAPTTPTVMIPTLSEWGLVALGILLAGLAAMRIRKAHARRS